MPMSVRWRRALERSVPIALVFAACAALGGATIAAMQAARRNRAMTERSLKDFASLAAWSYSIRLYATFANAMDALVASAGVALPNDPDADLRKLQTTIDSLVRCRCAFVIPSTGIAVGTWGERGTARLLSRANLSPDERAERLRVLEDAAARGMNTRAPVRFGVGQTARGTFAFAITRRPNDATAEHPRFVALDLDLPVTRDSVFGEVYTLRPLLLPPDLARVDENEQLVELIVSDRNGRDLFHSNARFPRTFSATIPLPRDSTLQVTAALSPAAASALVRGALPTRDLWVEVALPILATVMFIAIALLVYRAHTLSRLRTQFAASVTHELRTPLTHILINAETLEMRRARSAGEEKMFLRSIVEESRRLVHLVENVLHFSRAERRLLHLSADVTRLDEVVGRLVDELRPGATAAGVALALEAPAPVTALADSNGLRLIITNLVDNAIRHGGGSVIRVRVESRSDPEIVIDDEGPGIPAKDRGRVLQPFVRLRDAQRRHPTGSGIGLAVVSEVATAMGATVILEDAVPHGLRVRVVFGHQAQMSAAQSSP
jgi:signal transduction histidine kinase